jgi:DNA invertase Pin-like site-specific DNA recombinase
MASQELPVGQGQDSGVPVAIYTRVSTDNQTGGRFDSCESQAAICREMIRKREPEGWHEIACFSDAAYSGGTMDRPGIRALKRQIEAGEVKVVLIFKMERVLRSTDEWVPFRSFLQKHGCRLESATEDISEATPSGRLKNNLLMSVAEYERLNTAEKTRAKLFQQAKQGIWNGGWVPYGFDYDEKSQMLVPSPTEAPVLRRIFTEAAKFKSLEAVAKSLNDEGLRTRVRQIKRRSGKIQKVGGNLFRSDGLRMMLKNPIYRGAIRFGGQEHPARHKPLVSESVWHKANAVALDVQASPDPRVVDRDSQTYLLKGLIHCSSCGRALTPHDSGKKNPKGEPYRYYYCGKVLKEKKPESCPVGRLPADAVEAVVAEFIGRLSQHPDMVKAVIEESKVRRGAKKPDLIKQVASIKRSLKKVKGQLKNCIDVAVSGGVAVVSESFRERIAELEKERNRLVVALERKQQALSLEATEIHESKRVIGALRRFGELFPQIPLLEQKRLFRLCVDRVEVGGARKRMEKGRKLLELRVRTHFPRLVEGLELDALKKNESITRNLAPSVAGINFKVKADLSRIKQGEVRILAPFKQVVYSVRSRRAGDAPVPERALHPIRKAKKWNAMLSKAETIDQISLSKKLGVSPSVLNKHLRLLKLAPEIQEFLCSLKSTTDTRKFSMTRMNAIADLPKAKQRHVFAKMCS